MESRSDEMTAQALEQGRRNAQAIELVKKHCRYARVEPARHLGHSMLEDLTGLPISGREMRCEFGQIPSLIAPGLLTNAIRFYSENCVVCEHRDVQGIPNLKTVAEQHIARDGERAEESERERTRLDDAARMRADHRARAVATEEPATRALVSLVDRIDCPEPDPRASGEFRDLCRLHPETCTERASTILLEAADEIAADAFFEGLGFLDSAGRLPRDRVLEVAVRALTRAGSLSAGRIVLRLQDGLTPGQIRGAIPAIVYLSTDREPFEGAKPDLALLQLAATLELPAVLDKIREWLSDSEAKESRRVAASAAERLIEVESGAAAVLVDPLVSALGLPGSLGHYVGDPESAIVGALGAALIADGEATTTAIDSAAAMAGEPVRHALFRVYDAAIPHRDLPADDPAPEMEVALDASIRRLAGDWGPEIAASAAATIELASSWHPDRLAGRVDQIFGALIAFTAPPDRTAQVLMAAPSGPDEFLRGLEEQGERMRHSATIRDLREALGNLVEVASGDVARNVFSVINADSDGEDAALLRDEAVCLLGPLGKRPDALPEVVPMLWASLVHREQRVRARAVEAWREVASTGTVLPPDLGYLLPTLLADPYVIVHSEAVRALDYGLPVPDEVLEKVLVGLFTLANHYAADRSGLLKHILDTAWRESGRLGADATRAWREFCLIRAEHLSDYDKKRLVERWARVERDLPSFVPRMIEVVEAAGRTNSERDDTNLRILRDLPAEQLRPHVDALVSAARTQFRAGPYAAQKFVEILQRCGEWETAADLAQDIAASVPDDVEHQVMHAAASEIRHLARLNAMVAVDAQAEGVQEELDSARRASEVQRVARRDYRAPWEDDVQQ